MTGIRTLNDAIEQLKCDHDLCLFDPVTNEVRVTEGHNGETATAIEKVIAYIDGVKDAREALYKEAIFHNGTDYGRGIEYALLTLRKFIARRTGEVR